MKESLKRIFSIILIFALVITMMPVTGLSPVAEAAEKTPCSGCTLKMFHGLNVCYKEGSGIHVCETNFGNSMNSVGSKYDKDPENGYISPEEEPNVMIDDDEYWYFFDIVEVNATSGGTYDLARFPNLRTVKIENSATVYLGGGNTKLESIQLTGSAQTYTVDGLDQVPSSAPLQRIEIENATVDRYDYNFPTLETLILTDSIIDGEADDQIFITKDCAAIKHIDLSGTDISHNGADNNISYDLTNLEYLDVSKTGIKNVNIAYYSKLKYFYAKDNGLTAIIGARGEHDKTLADKCPQLIEVDVSGNKLTAFEVGEHPKLKKLDLSNNKFKAYSLNGAKKIKEFYINQKNEAGSYTNELAALYVMNCPELEIIDAGYQMNSSFGFAFDNLPKLKELDLTQCFAITSIPADVAETVEILKINDCTGLNEQFSAAKYPKLKELYAKNVTIKSIDGTKGLSVSAPNVEVIEYNGTRTAEWVGFRNTNNLKSFRLENTNTLKSVTVNGAESLEELWLGNNVNLEEVILEGTYGLQTLDIHVDDPLGTSKIKSIDFTDCYSLAKVGVSKGAENITMLYPSHPGYPDVEMTGWKWYDCESEWQGVDYYRITFKSKITEDFGDHGDNHYRGQGYDEDYWWWPDCGTVAGQYHITGTYASTISKEDRYITWNYAQWDGMHVEWDDEYYDERYHSVATVGHLAEFNLSPYKETSVKRYSGYAVTAPTGEEVDMPGLVGWATKKFATEDEIEYYAGEKIILEGDITFYPVYNTETKVIYNVGNYGTDIGVDEEAIEELGLEKLYNDGYYEHVVYEKSSLSDYWTYEVLNFIPSCEGYIFKGWKYSTSSGWVTYQPGDEIEFVGDKPVTLSADWEKAVDNLFNAVLLMYSPNTFEIGDTVNIEARTFPSYYDANPMPDGVSGYAELYTWTEDEPESVKVDSAYFTKGYPTFKYKFTDDTPRAFQVKLYTNASGGDLSQNYCTDTIGYIYPSEKMNAVVKYTVGDETYTYGVDGNGDIYIPQGSTPGKIWVESISGGNPDNHKYYDVVIQKNKANVKQGTVDSTALSSESGNNVITYDTNGSLDSYDHYRIYIYDGNDTELVAGNIYVHPTPDFEVRDSADISSSSLEPTVVGYAQTIKLWVDTTGYKVTGKLQRGIMTGRNQWTYSDVADAYVSNAGQSNGPTNTAYDKKHSVNVSIPATSSATTYRYRILLTDGYGNQLQRTFYIKYDPTAVTDIVAMYDNSAIKVAKKNSTQTGFSFTNGTDVVIDLSDLTPILDSTNKDYEYWRNKYGTIRPVEADNYEIWVNTMMRWPSYDDFSNHYDWFDDINPETGEYYVYDALYENGLTSDKHWNIDENWERYIGTYSKLPNTVDVIPKGLKPGFYEVDLLIKTSKTGVSIKTRNAGTLIHFEILENGEIHVHDYSYYSSKNDSETHIEHCYCEATRENEHNFIASWYGKGMPQPVEGWYTTRFTDGTKNENNEFNYWPSAYEQHKCDVCGYSEKRLAFVDSITLSQTAAELEVDSTLKLTAMIDFREIGGNPSNPTTYDTTGYVAPNTTVFWKSSNTDVATVDENGVVTTVGEGVALITATTQQTDGWVEDGYTGKGLSAECLINVNCQHTKHKVKIPAQDPTCQADGHVEHYKCLDCTKYSLTGDFTDTVSYEKDIKIPMVDHAKLYGVWHSDENGHWRECKYGCGTKYDQSTHYASTPANCQHPESCDTCGYVLAPITDHSHNKYGWSEGYHWSICECGLVVSGSNEVHQFGADGSAKKCDDCGYEKFVGYTVTGNVTSFLDTDEDITVQLLLEDNTVAYSVVVDSYTEVSASKKEYTSAFTIPDVVDGTYRLVVSKANHVTREYVVTVQGGAINQDVKIHLVGDITGDGKINSLDKKMVYNHMKGTKLIGYEFDVANVNGDTKINSLDKKMIYNHIKGTTKLW